MVPVSEKVLSNCNFVPLVTHILSRSALEIKVDQNAQQRHNSKLITLKKNQVNLTLNNQCGSLSLQILISLKITMHVSWENRRVSSRLNLVRF